MCDYFSGIITKDKKVLTNVSDSHASIKQEFKLEDKKPVDKLDWYPFEILPKKNKTVFDKPTKANWRFALEVCNGHTDGFKPKWFTAKHEEACWKAFKKSWKERVIQNCKIKLLENKQNIFIRNCEINIIKNSTVSKMCGNSTVNEMYNNSTVSKMYNNSTVNEMWDNSTVSKMYNNSTVSKMWDNSTVNEMYNNSTVSKMCGNSTVNEMWDNSTVKLIDSIYAVVKLFSGTVKKLVKGTILDFSGIKPNVKKKY